MCNGSERLCILVRTRVCAGVCVRGEAGVRARVRARVRVRVRVSMRVRARVRARVHVRVRGNVVHANVFVYGHTYVYEYEYVYVQVCALASAVARSSRFFIRNIPSLSISLTPSSPQSCSRPSSLDAHSLDLIVA